LTSDSDPSEGDPSEPANTAENSDDSGKGKSDTPHSDDEDSVDYPDEPSADESAEEIGDDNDDGEGDSDNGEAEASQASGDEETHHGVGEESQQGTGVAAQGDIRDVSMPTSSPLTPIASSQDIPRTPPAAPADEASSECDSLILLLSFPYNACYCILCSLSSYSKRNQDAHRYDSIILIVILEFLALTPRALSSSRSLSSACFLALEAASHLFGGFR
jgi:hypothetical protein